MNGMHLPERYTATSRLGDRRQDDSGALSVRVDEGPKDWYHGVPGHGFVGTRAIRFDGTASGGAHRVLLHRVHRVLLHDVDELIAETTELSYVIGYRLDDELRYAGGHVAVDVVLDDGSRAPRTASSISSAIGWIQSPRAPPRRCTRTSGICVASPSDRSLVDVRWRSSCPGMRHRDRT